MSIGFWNKFWNEFTKGTIIAGVLAVMIWSAIIFLAVTSREMPEVLAVGGGAIVGYFFRVRTNAQISREIQREVARLNLM